MIRKGILICFILLLISTSLLFASEMYTESDLDNLQSGERIEALLYLADKLTEEEPQKAYTLAQEAFELTEGSDHVPEHIDAINTLGYITLFLHDFEASINYFQSAYTLSIENEDDIGAAFSKNGYGLIWMTIDDYTNALKNFEKALELFELHDHTQGKAYVLNNIGTVYESLGSYNESLDHYLKALRLHEEVENLEEIAVTYNNIASINTKLGNQEDAFKYYLQSLEINEVLNKKNAIADLLNNLGSFFYQFGYADEALSYFNASLELSESIESDSKMATSYANIALVYEVYNDYDRAFENYSTALSLYEHVQDAEGMISVQNNLGTLYNKLEEYETALQYHQAALNLSKEVQYKDGLKSSLQNIANDYQMLGDYQNANRYLILYTQLKDALQNDEVAAKFAESQTLYETEKKNEQIEVQQQEIAERERRARILVMIISAITAFLLIIAGLAILIAKERAKSEKLLLNILPKKIATTLKKTGKAESESFENVTVYFSDIVGFTNASSGLDPAYLISELNDMFTLFDDIMEYHQCERIKTIGDAYMAVCGMPNPNENHAENIIKASRDILAALSKRNDSSEIQWRIRIGIHSGKVTGGVVGIKKYIYDVFGDTINTASRMESNSEAMRINVSERTYDITNSTFQFIKREPMEIKGKGMFQMYFLDHEILPVLTTGIEETSK